LAALAHPFPVLTRLLTRGAPLEGRHAYVRDCFSNIAYHVGSAAPAIAQGDNGRVVVILRGSTAPTTVTNPAALAAPVTNGVTIMTGMPIMGATPRQTSELPGAPLATGNGAGANAGLGAGAANPSSNGATGNAAIGAGAGMSGGTIAPPARSGFGRPVGGVGRGGFGGK
jgi:hypothetical protein